MIAIHKINIIFININNMGSFYTLIYIFFCTLALNYKISRKNNYPIRV
jgi:hypothetical protein